MLLNTIEGAGRVPLKTAKIQVPNMFKNFSAASFKSPRYVRDEQEPGSKERSPVLKWMDWHRQAGRQTSHVSERRKGVGKQYVALKF